MKNIVIVESPAKSKTINRYLGKNFTVLASYGHVRDLPSKNGSVNPDDQFSMVWAVDDRSKKHIAAIEKAVKEADHVYLATDPDREGEAISWHIAEILKEKKQFAGKKIERIVFNEITKSAVQNALANPRSINQELVDAYLARRALDYLVGFNISPVLWRKLPGSRSAGRVQSVALRLIVDREDDIERFIREEYWSITGQFKGNKKKNFFAKLSKFNGKKIEKFSVTNEAQAKEIVEILKSQDYTITSLDKKNIKRNPSAPFITSTLQQEAARKLGFGASRTMRLAQKLYEGIDINGESTGLITYMRTDGTQLAGEAVSAIRFAIQKKYGDQYLPKSPNVYKSKVKNAQEAHEAIRPTDITRTPESLKGILDEAHLKLYTLIWKRTIACQMAQAIFDQLTAVIENDDKNNAFKATGTTLVFDGFLAVYQEGKDDEEQDDETVLPPLEVNEKLAVQDILPKQHFTEPPARYSEASLVKKLEELGIGRPSTYATILQVLQDRAYVKLEKRYFTPEVRGRLVTTFLKNYFSRYVEYDFTAKLEDQLDDISSGELKWLEVIKQFWDPFYENVSSALQLDITKVIETIEKELSQLLFQAEGSDHKCPKCQKGEVHLRLGKYGAFLGCTLYPECDYTRQLTTESTDQENAPVDDSTISLGKDPNTGSEITLRKGPYGFYLQWEGEVEEALPSKTNRKKTAAPKPKRVGIPSGTAPASVTLEQALSLKQIPKFLGNHPDTDEPLILGLGRFGPYVKHKDLFASIPKSIPYLEISLEKAIELVNAKALKVTKKKESAE